MFVWKEKKISRSKGDKNVEKRKQNEKSPHRTLNDVGKMQIEINHVPKNIFLLTLELQNVVYVVCIGL